MCPYKGLPGVLDGGCLLSVIGSSGIDQGRVGGLGTYHRVGLGVRSIFVYNMSILAASC